MHAQQLRLFVKQHKNGSTRTRPQAASDYKEHRLLLSDVSVTHCCADTYVATAATTAGSATEARAAKKVAKYALREPGGYDFTPLVVESYGRQCSATHTRS